MIVSLKLNDDDMKLIKKYAKFHNVSLSKLFHQAVMDKIEDEYDLSAFNRAMEEYKKDSTTYSLEEVEKELRLL